MKIEAKEYSNYLNSFKEHKRIVLFGDTEKVINLQKITEKSGFEVAYFVGLTEQGQVKSYMDLLYEESDFYVWVVSSEYHQLCQRLNDIGLQYMEHYEVITLAGTMQNINRRFCLDVNLGYSYQSQSEYAGVTVFGKEDTSKKTIRIVTLGGSTTDSAMYKWKSWSELLYEMLKDTYTNYNAVIYSGGVAGYNSAQELIKLQRDMLNLEPDVVISFSGINDIDDSKVLPWVCGYQRILFDKLLALNTPDFTGGITQRYSMGIETRDNTSQCWLKNIRLMHAVCQELNIRYYAMLQPCVLEEQFFSLDDRTINGMLGEMGIKPSKYKRREEIIGRMKEEISDYDYIYDLTRIFDGNEQVYIDSVHVTEEGNRIIAEKIYDIVFEDFKN